MARSPASIGRRAAGAVIVRRDGGEPRYLLLRAYRYWDFPKGGIGAGEEPLAAAQREVEEETTLRDLRFAWGEVYRETAPYAGNKVARYYLAEAASSELSDQVSLPVSSELGRPEHHEFRWLTYAQARALLGERLQQILDWAEALVRGGG
ncbi:MAG TPA: NUDIX domain-containing protein [Thermoanaerobaculia bacterium]|jgi:bis(5'-nucleosidyl)-tetraphosphatase|nr:NUDIX domain-containing protein [Thermoanaerobaculia bacterium]